ncbi:MAG: DUF1385 domain-containing protein [Candidatus Sumerlaeia bacterium]|nr:DUF1385 domain-containing protein [Candidatus Sumerlaeia bacterium]
MDIGLNHRDAHLSGNPSATPPRGVGGLALPDGVLIRSRTGYSTARRRADGAIAVEQVPFAGFAESSRWARLPVARGVAGFAESLLLSCALVRAGSPPPPASPAEAWADPAARRSLRGASAALLLGLLAPLPAAWWLLAGVLAAMGGSAALMNESDAPAAAAALLFSLRAALLGAAAAWSGRSGELHRYHGAEHRALHCFEEGRGPTVGRALRQPALHGRCGFMLYADALLLQGALGAGALWLLANTVTGFPAWPAPARLALWSAAELALLPLAVGLAGEAAALRGRLRPRWLALALEAPGRALQRLTLRSPSAAHVECAIVALLGAVSIPDARGARASYLVPGLVDDESAPGYRAPALARPAAKAAVEPPRAAEPTLA